MSILAETVDPTVISLEYLIQHKLNNDLIFNYILYYTGLSGSSEEIGKYKGHIDVLRSKYDKDSAIRDLEVEIFGWSPYYQRDIKYRAFDLARLNNFFYLSPDLAFEDMVIKIITQYPADPDAVLHLRNLMKIYNVENLDLELIKQIYDIIYENPNGPSEADIETEAEDQTIILQGAGINGIKRFLDEVIPESFGYADPPSYMRQLSEKIDVEEFADTSTLPTVSYVINIDQSVDQIAAEVIDQTKEYGITILSDDGKTEISDEKITDKVKSKISEMPAYKKVSLINDSNLDIKKLVDVIFDRRLFMLTGPVNPYIIQDWTSIRDSNGSFDINKIYGGPRMLLDNSTQSEKEDDNLSDSWFLGHCQWCMKRIMKIWFGVRIPEFYGGWSGCFCSWDCVRGQLLSIYPDESFAKLAIYDKDSILKSNLTEEQKENYKLLLDMYGKEALQQIDVQLLLVEAFENITNKICIIDRIVSDEETVEENDELEDVFQNFDLEEIEDEHHSSQYSISVEKQEQIMEQLPKVEEISEPIINLDIFNTIKALIIANPGLDTRGLYKIISDGFKLHSKNSPGTRNVFTIENLSTNDSIPIESILFFGARPIMEKMKFNY